jgi:methylated-DNA-[protein]-cysteine S-methyltransferase
MDTPAGQICYSSFRSPVGPVYVAHDGQEPLAVRPARSRQAFEDWLRLYFGATPRSAELPEPVKQAMEAALAGRGRRPALEHVADFERAVLLKTCEIPRGEVRTYAWIAAQLGRPWAAREVGVVLANNPLPLVVPCHRVVRSDGRLGGYNCGGPTAKRALLEYEGLNQAPSPFWNDRYGSPAAARATR